MRRPLGDGRRKLANNDVDGLVFKMSHQHPQDDKELCCANAILMTLAHVIKDKTAIEAIAKKIAQLWCEESVPAKKRRESP